MVTCESINAARAEIVGGADVSSIRAIFDPEDRNIISFSQRQIQYHDADMCEISGSANLTSRSLRPTEVIVDATRLDDSVFVFTNHGKIAMWSLEDRCWMNELALPIKPGESLMSCKMLSRRQYVYTMLNNETNEITINCSMSRSERERPKTRETLDECSIGDCTSFDLMPLVAQADLINSPKREANQRYLMYMKRSKVMFRKIAINEKVTNICFGQTISAPITCVKANRVRPMAAIGDATGRIYIYSGNFDEEKLNRDRLHWHSLAVSDLCFSSTGNRLYSCGGESGCIVIWDLSYNNLGAKHVVARLGLPIRFISCANRLNELCLVFEDNDIAILDTNNNLRRLSGLTRRTNKMYQHNDFRSLRIPFPRAESIHQTTHFDEYSNKSIGLLLDPRFDSVVCNSHTGQLQFYSPHKQKKVDQIDITGNKIMSLETKSVILPSDIVSATFSADGSWLACHETLSLDGYFPEVKLHIWMRPVNNWIWIQTVDRVHESTDIVDMKFSADGNYLVSVCKDGTFHVFHRITLESKSSEKSNSKQLYVKGFSAKTPSGVPAMAAFSHDSSVLALSLTNDTILIWMIESPYKLLYEYQLNLSIVDEPRPYQQPITSDHVSDVLGLTFGRHESPEKMAPLCEIRTSEIRIWNVLDARKSVTYAASKAPLLDTQEVDEMSVPTFTAAAFDHINSKNNSPIHFAVSNTHNLIMIFNLKLGSGSNLDELTPLFCVNGALSFKRQLSPIYTHMCFVKKPVLDIDLGCYSDPSATKLLSRLCLLNSYQELVSFSDHLTLEKRHAINSCNQIKTTELNELQNYFIRQYSSQSNNEDFADIDRARMTAKQRQIRNRVQIQKMLQNLLDRIPSQNLPSMDVLGPMILDKLALSESKI